MVIMKPEVADRLDTPDGLHRALQLAIKLEHSTIPPYLYAVFSLPQGVNARAGTIVTSVVAEEMAHMALAGNILNAIKGHPSIDDPEFIPRYPHALPGTVEKGLVVGLAPMSLDLIEKVFMAIEEPEDPHNYPVAGALAAEATRPLTIGGFYAKIKAALQTAGPSIFKGDPSYQVSHNFASSEVVPIRSLGDAMTTIDTIVDQGEGTATSPLDMAGDELAHYYRFAEIVKRAELVPWPDHPPDQPPWHYAGAPIPFDETAVLPAVENPKSSDYPAGSAARRGCETFNYTYTALLKVLHDTFNGHPTRLPTAIGLMESLQDQAQALMSLETGLLGGRRAGPSFEYQPTNP